MRLRHLAVALALSACYVPPTSQSSSAGTTGGSHGASTSGPTTGPSSSSGGTTCWCDTGGCWPPGCDSGGPSSGSSTGTTTASSTTGATTGMGVTGGTTGGSNTCPGGFGTGVSPGGACAQDSDCCDIGDEPFYDYGCIQGTCQLVSVSGPTGGTGSSTGSTASTGSTGSTTGSTGGTGSTGTGWVDQSSTTCSFMNATNGVATGAGGVTGNSGSTGGGAPPRCHWTGVKVDWTNQTCSPGASVDCDGSACTCTAPDGSVTLTFNDGTPGDCFTNQQRCP